MRKVFFLLLLLGLTTSVFPADKNKKIYVWRNAEGVLVFSDSPQPNVKADTVNVTKTPNIAKSVDTSILKGSSANETKDVFSVHIVKPLDQATIRDNTGTIYINGAVKPVFQRGMRVVVKLDGKTASQPQKSAVFILHDVDRGEHTIQLEVLNDSGKVIATSDIVTFYLHRNLIITPK